MDRNSLETIAKAKKFCQTIGVELNEEWGFYIPPDEKPTKFRIRVIGYDVFWEFLTRIKNDYGWLDIMEKYDSSDILDIIIHSDKIIHFIHVTQDDVNDAVAVIRLFPNAYSIKRANDGSVLLKTKNNDGNNFYLLNKNTFPSIQEKHNTVTLCDIMANYEGENNGKKDKENN